jgi:small conductance mechanosensitive channel
MDNSSREIVDQITALIAKYGLDVVAALVILVVGWVVAGWAKRAVTKTLSKSSRVDETLRQFFGDLTRYVVIIFTVLAVLDQFGVQTASLLAVFGAGALAIGLALQGTLSNVAAGVMLLIFRPFKVGDYVETAGQAGTVRSVNLFVTELATPDNIQILLPNGQVWGSAVRNYSHNPTRRIDIVVGIAYGDSIAKASESCMAVVKGDDRILNDPEPMVAVNGLGESSVDILVRFWCNGGDYWPLRFDTTRALKERMDADGITIPFPQRDVHLMQPTG